MIKWIKVDEILPEHDDDGESDDYLITDGENISIGWHEAEYNPDYPLGDLQYSSPVWHDHCNLLNCDCCGWPKVTHWAAMPELPFTG